jgi:hypothetical protein
MSLSPNLLNLALLISGILLSLAGIAWLLWSLFSDRPRGRRRCPSCWYDFAGLATNSRCPECGRAPKSDRDLARTRRRPLAAILATILFLLGYATWTTPRSFREKSATGLIPTTFLVLTAPTLVASDAAATTDGLLRETALLRLSNGDIASPWRWLWRQRLRLALTLSSTPYIQISDDEAQRLQEGPNVRPLAEFVDMLADDQFRNPVMQAPFTDVVLLAGDAKLVGHLDRMMNVLRQADAESRRPGGPRQVRFDVGDQTADQAIYDKLESLYLPEWEGPITLAHLAAMIEEHAGVPVAFYDGSLASPRVDAILGQQWPMITVTELLDQITLNPSGRVSWHVHGGRIHLGDRLAMGSFAPVVRVLLARQTPRPAEQPREDDPGSEHLAAALRGLNHRRLKGYSVEACGDALIIRAELAAAHQIESLINAAANPPADGRLQRVDVTAPFPEREGRSTAQTLAIRTKASALPPSHVAAERWSPHVIAIDPDCIVTLYHLESLHDRIWNAPGWKVIRTPGDPPHPGVATTVLNEIDARLKAKEIEASIDFRSSLSPTSIIVLARPETQDAIEQNLREIEAMPISRINTLDYRIIP